ncbi:O-antigen ligase family protein [Flavobacterium sp.]|jgi:exopolysaccharide production protein ExoQ|uniref:O-antigen ligase family protein n=1 Tax=Flavobacterium sp. TaxID=239 RepID=UPI0022C0EA76|nr:O-antigen ligase family protein [Flavobacterium sp.]MCZ8145290.1 O-antigen ligase family protein [Flavobacterium sp.]MCZ8366829.1 O-antigen ligase family protein [Flavobacterium sp.]
MYLVQAHHQSFLKQTETYLFILLFLMVGCFFTWSENVAITRAIKVVGRNFVMLGSIAMYYRIVRYGAADSFKYKNTFSILFYLIYLFLGFLSFAWSTNPGFSALQWFMTFQSLVFAYYFIKCIKLLDLYFEGHSIRLYHLLGNVVFYLQLIFVVGMWIDPDTFFRMTHGGEEARLGGIIMNPNELGMLAGVGVACLIFDLYRFKSKFWTILKLLVIFYALFLTGSRSSLIGALLIIFFHINQTKRQGLKMAIMGGVLMVIPFAVHQIILKGGDKERLEEILTLTGRLPFWQALINEGLPREPLLGFGFMRIDYKEYFQSTHTYPGKMTHNTFMQVLMNLGFIGLTVALFQVFFTIHSILKENTENKLMLLGILIPIMINSFTEFGIFGESNYGILFYQLVVFAVIFENNPRITSIQRHFLRLRRPEVFSSKR